MICNFRYSSFNNSKNPVAPIGDDRQLSQHYTKQVHTRQIKKNTHNRHRNNINSNELNNGEETQEWRDEIWCLFAPVLVCPSRLVSCQSVGELQWAARLCWCFLPAVSAGSAEACGRHMTAGWRPSAQTYLALTSPLTLSSRPPNPRPGRTWKKVATVCPSRSVTWYLRQPPVWETSPHWTSPTTTICPLTPATRPTPRKKVSSSRLTITLITRLIH